MAFKIGFMANQPEQGERDVLVAAPQQDVVPRKSVVQVHFPDRNMTLAYYNDQFDLHPGDLVFVDGKLEGLRGRVTDVNYNFKIKVSEFKRVIAVADTNVRGQFYILGSHFAAFDPGTLPRSKVRSWYKAPAASDDEFVSGTDDSSFSLNELSGMNVSKAIAERGHDYYIENRVVYLNIDGTTGYAIVEGGEPYEVEFDYVDGQISHLICSCLCSYNCKHEFAAMLQLRESLDMIEKHYADEFKRTNYFAVIAKGALFSFVIAVKETGSFVI